MGKFLVIALALLIGLVSCVSAPTSSPTQMPQELIGKWEIFVVSEDGGQTNMGVKDVSSFEIFKDKMIFVNGESFALQTQAYNTTTKHIEITYTDGEEWTVRPQMYHGVKIIAVVVLSADGEEEFRFAAKPVGSADFDSQKNLYRPKTKLNITNL
jgi:hypothetical protein